MAEGKVLWSVTMSLDGYIAGPDHAMDWVFEYTDRSEFADEVKNSTGAILAGRRWHDLAIERWNGRAGIYGGAWSGPVFVLTHHPPEDPPDPEIRFLSGSVEDAVATAMEAAAGKNVLLFGGTLFRQAVDAGLLDEVVIHLAPVLLGDGVRFYEQPGGKQVNLEKIQLGEAGQLTDIRLRVKKSG